MVLLILLDKYLDRINEDSADKILAIIDGSLP